MAQYGRQAGWAGAAHGVLRGVQDLQRRYAADYYRRRDARASLGIEAAKSNPAVLNDPEMIGFLTDYYGIPAEQLRSMFPTSEQRLESALPGLEAATGLPPAEPETKVSIGYGVEPPEKLQAGKGMARGMRGQDVEALQQKGISVSGDMPQVEVGPMPTSGERLGRLTANLPPGYSITYDPASGGVKLTGKGPSQPTKADQDNPVVMNMFMEIGRQLEVLHPEMPEYQRFAQAAQLALDASAQHGLIPPKYLFDLAMVTTEEQAAIALEKAKSDIRLRGAGPEAYESARGRYLGEQTARVEEAGGAGLRGGAGAPTPGAGAPLPRQESAATGPSGSALNQPRQPGATRASGRFEGWAEGYDAPPENVASQRVQQPNQNGYIIGDVLTDNDLTDAASFGGLVITREKTGRYVAVKQGEVPKGAIAERPEILLDRRAGFKMMDKKTTQQQNANIVRDRIKNIRELNATDILVRMGVSPEEVEKNPLAHLGAAASAAIRGQVRGRAALVTMRMAGVKKAIALAALETLVTPAVKAMGDVGQITEPDKAPIRVLLQAIWAGTATKEQADATLDYLDEMMGLLASAPKVSPEVAAMVHNGNPLDPRQTLQIRDSVTKAIEADNQLRPGQLESDAFFRQNGLLGGAQ